jgi:hypothetical protein
MARRAVLTFNTDTGGSIRINIPRARVKDAAEATAGMNALIATQILQSVNGRANGISSAKLVDTTVTRIN